MNTKQTALITATFVVTALPTYAAMDTAMGTINADFRMRYEAVDQDNAAKDASALTVRSKINLKTPSNNGFYGFLELENTTAFVDDFNDTLGNNTEYSVVADPDSTELDQGYLGYTNDKLNVKVGRQVITMDNHRFVGHVGWRQDKQTFDAITASYAASKHWKVSYGYINKRNRIFSDEKDVDAKDHLFNAQLTTSVGKFTGYGYLLEVDNGTDNGLDTFGVRYQGKAENLSYTAEFASQTAETAGVEFDTSYFLAEVSAKLSGFVVKAGYESLGSDGGKAGFATPLATLHKFNGWADQFLATPSVGLNDLYVGVSGKGQYGKWAATFHSYSADESSATVDDLGSEINLVYTSKIAQKYPVGIKYAAYSAGDMAAGKVDANKLWVWIGASF